MEGFNFSKIRQSNDMVDLGAPIRNGYRQKSCTISTKDEDKVG